MLFGKKTGAAIYLNPKVRVTVINYVTVSDRILSTTLLTKAGPLAIINHHAPDETKPSDTKTAHWDLLSTTVRNLQSDAIKIIIGDTNIKWHGRYRGEEDILGPHIFGKGTDYLDTHSHENRDLGVSFLRSHKLYFIIIHYQKPPRKRQLLETLFASTVLLAIGIHLYILTRF